MIVYTLLTFGIVSLVVLCVAYVCVFQKLRRPTELVPSAGLPRLTVLKPLKGVDPGLEENLRAIFTQDHPNFDIVFGAEDPNDPALDVVRRLAKTYTERKIQITDGCPGHGYNPKVRILREMLREVTSEWVLISDSNVRPGPDYLRVMQSVQIRDGADLVHTVLAGTRGESLGGRLEEVQLNGWVAASICFAQRFGHPCVIGKSMLMRRDYLQSGALFRVKNILAEDYTLGAELHRAGKKVSLAPYRLPVVTGEGTVAAFFNRHVRWGQMRRHIAPGCFVLELSANPTPFLVGALLLGEGVLFQTAALLQVIKWAVDVAAYCRLSSRPSLASVALMPLKDLLVPVMWAISAFKRTVSWRGHVMQVGPASRLMAVPPSPFTGPPAAARTSFG